MRLKGKVALLAGVWAGMEAATSLQFAQEGVKIAATARNEKYLGKDVSHIQSISGQDIKVPSDESVK